jgi:sec-independent protein translocase protein TatB
MEILGIGPLELLFILLIALIILGPGDMVKAGRTLGRFLRKIVTSSEWRTVQKASRELRYLPNRLMREASLEDLQNDLADINKIGGQITSEVKKVELDLSSWTTPPESDIPASEPITTEEPKPKVTEIPDNPEAPQNLN